MQYMLMVCDGRTHTAGPDEIDATPEFVRWTEQVAKLGATRRGILLRPAAEAVTVRVRDGELLVTDGPFAETREQIGGLELVECADLDVAIEIASGHPGSREYPVEIRPFWQWED